MVTGKVVVITVGYGYVPKKTYLFLSWLWVIMGNFAQAIVMDYGLLRVIMDYGRLWVEILIFQHGSIFFMFFRFGGQSILFCSVVG